ncbi:MAG: hypothetical protein PHT12_04985 [Patescibacteria group bacterium]|nr:hypothetical protein [Patescibacteria group bacterium]
MPSKSGSALSQTEQAVQSIKRYIEENGSLLFVNLHSLKLHVKGHYRRDDFQVPERQSGGGLDAFIGSLAVTMEGFRFTTPYADCIDCRRTIGVVELYRPHELRTDLSFWWEQVKNEDIQVIWFMCMEQNGDHPCHCLITRQGQQNRQPAPDESPSKKALPN